MTKEELEQKITEANTAYYTDGTSLYSDYAYDQMCATLRELDPTNDLLKDLGEDHSAGFAKIKHEARMLSLLKIQAADPDEYTNLTSWVDGMNEGAVFCVEPKVDGMSAEAIYEHGKLLSVSTRGNGDEGDEITNNVRDCFPAQLDPAIVPVRFSVRGELYISRDNFAEINKRQVENDKPVFANARNLCAGTVKSKVPVTDRKVEFVAHGFVGPDAPHPTMLEVYDLLSQCGFACVPHELCIGTEAVCNVCTDINNARDTYPYCIDGAVVKLLSRAMQSVLGESEHHPYWACAFKYKPEVKKTTVVAINWQLGGKTGKTTPVAEVEPTVLDGTVVTRVSLANAGQMAAKGIKVGSVVMLEKANEIIPHIASVVDGEPYELKPTMECPSCASTMHLELGKAANTANYTCTNTNCPEQASARLLASLGTNGLNVLGVGPEMCMYIVTNCEERYTLRLVTWLLRGDIDLDDHLSRRQFESIDKEVQEIRNAPLHRWIAACQFPGCATGSAKKIAQRCRDWDEFYKAITDGADLGITKAAREGITGLIEAANREIREEMYINPKSDCYIDQSTPKPLDGKSFVVTGVFDTGRKAMEDLVAINGGVLRTSVSGKTDYVVAGREVGATKMTKAKQLGITVLTELEFLDMIK